MRLLTALTRKGRTFSWSPACKATFQLLKQTVTSDLVQAHFDRDKTAYVEADSSDYVSSSVFAQIGEDELLHPVAFFSKKLAPAKCNYKIYNKELLAIIRCFEEWRVELEGTELLVQVLTDRKSLEYFMITKKLT